MKVSYKEQGVSNFCEKAGLKIQIPLTSCNTYFWGE